MKYEVKDLNAPSRWNMRIWDDDKKEWLCQSDKDALTYYGFDITGGETTEFQGLPKWNPDRHLIWGQSTGLKDKNGKEVYEGDVIQCYLSPISSTIFTGVVEFRPGCIMFKNFADGGAYAFNRLGAIEAVIGNIHENPELLGVKNEKSS